MPELGPRVVVAATQSGAGKTTVATGLMVALRATGRRVASAKVGPDFIDPGYHSRATGRPPRNLDAWLCGLEAICPLAGRAGDDADILVVEGVMGLFDGSVDGTPSSTAAIAKELDAPVLLVVDAQAMSSSVAAIVHGFATLDPEVPIGGVILNQVGSEGHETLLREALAPLGIPVLGALHRDDRFTWRDRHLGLVPVAEAPQQVDTSLQILGAAVAQAIDLEEVMAVARSAPRRRVSAPVLPSDLRGPGESPVRIAVAAGAAFTFTYADTLDALHAAGGEILTFDPLVDHQLPEGTEALLIGGGFPEVFVAPLADNVLLARSIRSSIGAGIPTWAECGGLLWLCRDLDGVPGVGVVDAAASMTDRLTLGYREAQTLRASPIGPAGTLLRGHEFHHGAVEPGGDGLRLSSRWGERSEGHVSPTLLATFLHVHPGGDTAPIEAFVRSALRARHGTAAGCSDDV